jgi:2-oxo-4-hydroxy-4-carboxy-5-ureidoimidazoline decarboxylase
MTLNALNQMDAAEFVAALGGVFEHSPWVARAVFNSSPESRPFASVDALHAAMLDAVRHAAPEQQLALLKAHPELAGREASAGELTADSSSEQARLGFTSLSRAELEEISELNRCYREKFGFPCIVALNQHRTRDTVIATMAERLQHDLKTEMNVALEQIAHITRGRVNRIVTGI